MNRDHHTLDQNGFDYMENSGREEQDRDTVAMVFALITIAILTAFQYLGLY